MRRPRNLTAAALSVGLLGLAAVASGLAAPVGAAPNGEASAKIKVIADQDSAGPHGTNYLSLLMLLNAPQIDLLGITTVSGDQWADPSTIFALHAVELAGRTDVPVIKGAEQPLLRTGRDLEIAEELYGSFPQWRGVFNPDTPAPDYTWEPPGGYPTTEPHPGRAAEFIIDTVRANPGEVILYFAGPMTNLALAVRMDPGIVELVKSLYIMGPNDLGGPDFNWWWDPEAAAIVMREPWPEIFISTVGIGFDVPSSEQLMRRVVEAGGPFTDHIQELYLDYEADPELTVWSAMWDELTVAAIVDPSVITLSEEMWLDVDITHGPKYGHTVVWKRPGEGAPSFFLPYSGPGPIDRAQWESHLEPPAHLSPASVQMEVDVERFEEIFVELMSYSPSDR